MMFFELKPEHQGRRARIDGREGILYRAQNPAYTRRSVVHWWLKIPDARFGSAGLSLQWVPSTTEVEFLDAP